METRSSRALAARRRTYELSRFARANTGLSGTGCCPPAPCRHGTHAGIRLVDSPLGCPSEEWCGRPSVRAASGGDEMSPASARRGWAM